MEPLSAESYEADLEKESTILHKASNISVSPTRDSDGLSTEKMDEDMSMAKTTL